MKKILLVDDDADLTVMLAQYLRREQFEVETVFDGEAGVRAALSNTYALVVLDVMLPRHSGIEALRRIRASSRVPVLMLSARGDDIDRIMGLEMGADDYVPKPCTPAELAARIRAILRRSEPSEFSDRETAGREPGDLGPLRAGHLEIWPARRQALWKGNMLDLTGTEFVLLTELARFPGHLLSKDEISRRAFGRPLAPYDRRIDVHLSSIRQKLGAREDSQSWIQSVRGLGYQLLIN
jgi:DNA-binding response OmpR family regulator